MNEWAKDENYENIEIQLREFGQMGLVLGYGLLFRLSAIRFPLYLKEHDTEHAFYLRFSRIFQDDPVLFERSNTALEYIRNFSLNTFKKKRKSEEIDTDLLEKVNEIIWDQTISKISEDIDESLMRAARGDLEYKYLPNAISNELVELDIEIGKTPATLSLDNPISKDTQKATFKDELTDKTLNAQELIEDLENQKVIQKVIQKCRELLNDPKKLTNREKQVLQLYILEDEDYTLEDIGKELGVTRQTVHEEKNNVLKKLRRHFKKPPF